MKQTLPDQSRWSSVSREAKPHYAKSHRSCQAKDHCEEDWLDSRCPYCDQPLNQPGLSIARLLGGGVRQLVFALLMIGFAVARCLRFVLAGALCLFGFVGSCCRALGMQIAHANDRQFLKKL